MWVSYRNHGVCHQHHHILLALASCGFPLLVPSAALELQELYSLRRVRWLEDARLQPAALRQHLDLGIQPHQLLRQLLLSYQQEHQTS